MRILGIDIGTTSIRAVEVESSFRRFELHNYHEAKIPPGQSYLPVLESLILALPKKPEKIILALRTGQSTLRTMQFPTRDKKAISTSVAFEIEDELPFNIDDIAYDFSVIAQAGQNTQVHVATTLKKYLVALLNELEPNIECDVITSEAWAYRSLLNRTFGNNPPNRPVLLIDIGATRTTLYLHSQQAPRMIKEIPFGGQDFTLAISKKYQIPLSQAESSKLENGFILPPSQRSAATPEQIAFSDSLIEAILPILLEIRQTTLNCRSITKQTLGHIYLTGSTALLPGLTTFIEEEISIPTVFLRPLTQLGVVSVNYPLEAEASFSLATGLAFSYGSHEKISHINFRKGEFSKKSEQQNFEWKKFKKPALSASIVLTIFLISTTVQKIFYTEKLKTIDSQLDKNVRSFFGQLSASTVKGYISNPDQLKSNIKKEINKQKELNKLFASNPNSPIDFLRELSASIPKDTVLDMLNFQVGSAPTQPYNSNAENQIQLTFIVESTPVAEKIANLLSTKISGLQKSNVEEYTLPSTNEKKLKFTVTGTPIQNTPPEKVNGELNGK